MALAAVHGVAAIVRWLPSLLCLLQRLAIDVALLIAVCVAVRWQLVQY